MAGQSGAVSAVDNLLADDVRALGGIGPEDVRRLSEACLNAKSQAYCPYSNFPVGCSILLREGSAGAAAGETIIVGVNVENAAYPVGTCAERVAMGTAVSRGLRLGDVRAVAVAANTAAFCSPCGMCRQFLREFCAPDTPIVLHNRDGRRKVTTMGELLPYSFDVHMLEQAEDLSKST